MKNNQKLSRELVNDRLVNRDVEMIGDYISKDVKSLFKCIDGHTWLASPNNIMRAKGRGCPHCVGRAPLSKEIVNERLNLAGNGYTMIGEYVNISTHSIFKCSNRHTWSAKPNNIMNGRGCPKCPSTSGYRTTKPGWVYVIKYPTFIKYGITNDPKQRLSKHKRWGDYETLLLKKFEDGQVACRWEQDIKNEYGGSFIGKEIMGDGWSETLSPALLEEIISRTNDKYINEE